MFSFVLPHYALSGCKVGEARQAVRMKPRGGVAERESGRALRSRLCSGVLLACAVLGVGGIPALAAQVRGAAYKRAAIVRVPVSELARAPAEARQASAATPVALSATAPELVEPRPALPVLSPPFAVPRARAGQAQDGAPQGLPAASAAQDEATAAIAKRKVPAKHDVSRIGERGVGGGLDFYSLEREIAMGRELALEVEHGARLVRDPVVTEYINRLGQNLVRNSDARVPFTIKVVDEDEINAFALPGGFFYVNSGLILAADNEAELAGVMAHEIAHVAARHATKNATKSELLNLLSIPLIFVGGPAGYAVRQVVGLAVPMSFLKFSRDAEREADVLGLQYQYAAGYDPEEFVRLFEKLNAEEKRKRWFLAKAFQTHPMNEERVARAQKEIEQYLPPRERYIVDTSEFQEVKARLVEIMNRGRIEKENNVRPVLRRRPPEGSKGKEEKDTGPPVLSRP